MMTSTLEVAGLERDHVRLAQHQLDNLAARLRGPLLRAGDAGWDAAAQIWNARAATRPALVVQPTSAHDVAEVVAFARAYGLLLSIKGGGHNIAGTALAEDALTLDMSRMRAIEVDPAARLARVGPGCLLKDVDQATQRHGLATVLGFVSEVGVAGLTLGGGFGYLARRFGWAVDNLEAVEIVTADGAVRTASRVENPELFWAVRGGGGNFGVVTRFTFRLHSVGPIITGGLIAWSAEQADRVLAAYRELTAAAPRELTTALVMLIAPPAPFVPPRWQGEPITGLLVCHSGRDPRRDLAVLRELGEPILDLVTERPYVDQQSLLDDMEPRGLHQYWKAEYLAGLPPEFLGTFGDCALKLTTPLSYSVIFHIGGALNQRDEDDGAVGNRDAQFISGFSGVWPPGVPDDEPVAWVRASWERIRRFSTGGNYVNFQLAEDDAKRTAAAYGRSYQRLQHAKAAFDPDNLFRVNRNIPPAR